MVVCLLSLCHRHLVDGICPATEVDMGDRLRAVELEVVPVVLPAAAEVSKDG